MGKFLDYYKHTMPHAPKDKGPLRTMPKASDSKDYHKVYTSLS